MAPKSSKLKQVKTEAEQEIVAAEVSTSLPVEVMMHDLLEDLRYTPGQCKVHREFRAIKTTLIPVRKRCNVFTTLSSTNEVGPTLPSLAQVIPTLTLENTASRTAAFINYRRKMLSGPRKSDELELDVEAMDAPPLTRWVAPAELPLLQTPIEVLRRRMPMEINTKMRLKQRNRVEARHFRHYDKVKENQLAVENYLMAATGKDRSALLVRRHQLVPKIGSGGLERPRIQLEGTRSPISRTADDLFKFSEHLKLTKNGICPVMKKMDQGYIVFAEWVGCPHVTDAIMQKLGINLEDDSYETRDLQSSVPMIEKLGVVGSNGASLRKYTNYHSLATPDRLELFVSQPEVTRESSPSSRSSKRKSVMCMHKICGSKVSLLLGETALQWSTDPTSRSRVFTVELGCTTELGRSSVNSISLSNTGTTTVNYRWNRKNRQDKFSLRKYELVRFILDSDNKIILPGETFRIPVLYKGTVPGYYTEDWCLLTSPMVENGAEIILRLWGVTKPYENFRHQQFLNEATLEQRGKWSIVRGLIDSLLSHLPLKEASKADERLQKMLVGPELFCFLNPALKYRTTDVFMLGKLLTMIDSKETRGAHSHRMSTKSPSVQDISNIDVLTHSPVSAIERNTTFDPKEEEEVAEGKEPQRASEILANEVSEVVSERSVKSPTKRLAPKNWQSFLMLKIKDELGLYSTASPLIQNNRKTKGSCALNITRCDFSVDELRYKALTEIDDEEEQEGYLNFMTDYLSRLYFSNDLPVANISYVVFFTHLAETIDTFTEYATNLKNQLFEFWSLELEKRRQKLSEETLEPTIMELSDGAGVNMELVAERKMTTPLDLLPVPTKIPSIVDNEEVKVESNDNMDDNNNFLDFSDFNPRKDLDQKSYKRQYYEHLYSKMYLLLSEYFDKLDSLLRPIEETKSQYRHMAALTPGIQKVKEVKLRHTTLIESLLNAPLPPTWIRLAQRMEAAASVHTSSSVQTSKNSYSPTFD